MKEENSIRSAQCLSFDRIHMPKQAPVCGKPFRISPDCRESNPGRDAVWKNGNASSELIFITRIEFEGEFSFWTERNPLKT